MSLTEGSCEPCRAGAPALSSEEIEELKREVPDWGVLTKDGVARIQRDFPFKDFRQAMGFAVQVGDLAEREGHHPDLHVSWGKVVVETWTHKIRGLHRNDFILAAKIDALYSERP